ncbi:MAG TPA: hypothetical protein VGW33_08980 [Terriglobia bacterium]|nr:hypothetical protein [Terriglobia bacterium]
MREGKHGQPRQVRDASPVLQNRRERLEELTLEAQEHRARRELTKLEREEQKEAESREAEARAREEEAAQHQAEIEFERERLEHEKALERRGLERERAQEQARLDAQEELADFRQRWYDAAAVATPKLAWLTPGQRKEVTEALEAEIERRQPADEPRMGAIIARSLEALIEPLRAERDAQERRQKVTNEALWSLPHSATEAEKVNATAAIREALGRLDGSADVSEMRVAAQEAVRSIRQAVERRLLDARLLHWAIWQLPWGRTDRDEARIRRECAEILAEMPIDISEADGKEALESTVQEAGRGIELRQAEKQRQVRKASLVQQGVDEVSGYLWKLKNADEISADDYWDTDFNTDLKKAVQRGLDDELTGEETVSKVRELTRAIIDDALEG